jgi:type 2 lantibiotic biosynthesis protein LanM
LILERWLLSSLSQWASSALQLEFSLFRRQWFWSRATPKEKPSWKLYEAFLLQYQGQQALLSPFFGEYRLLARVLMLRVEQWVAACGEFVHCLQADLQEIAHHFHAGQPVGNVIKLIPGSSDPHHHGRSVFLLKFAAGFKLVYKPRSLALDQAFFSLLSPDELLEVARRIGLELCAQAFPLAQGYKSWVGFHFQPDLKYYSLQPVDFNLYDGTCGIALFLGALGSVTGEETFSTCAASALQLLCQHIRAAASPVLDSVGTGQAQSAQQLKQWGIGGASGLGSILYALTRLGTWLQQPELLEVARQAASLITTSRIHEDKSFDIIAGSAGAILGLLTLYKQTGEETLLERALLCGNHLLEQRIQTESGARSWATIEKESPLTGFSHGAAGIAYALLLLSQATEQHVFKDAAEEALRFEQHLFCPEVGNWLDLRKPEAPTEAETEPKFMVSWCHGAPGIGLARLGGLPILDTPQVRNEIQAALQTTLASGLSSLDKLCCGNFGGIELLVAASGRLEQPHLLQVAQQWTSALVHRATQRGGFHVLDQLPRQAFNPGFFQGHAGVGYQLLRVAFPERIPSVLLWE